MTTDYFADRFAAKLDSRIDEIEAAVPQLGGGGGVTDAIERAHRRAHDLCDVGPTMGFIAIGEAARIVERLLLAPLRAGRALTQDELALLPRYIAALRNAAHTDTKPAGRE